MKLTSVQNLLSEISRACKRFPVEVIFAIIACIAATTLIHNEDKSFSVSSWGWRVMMACNIGLLTSFASSLYSRYRNLDKKGTAILYLLSLTISVTFLFILNPMEQERDIVRFFLISFSLHLMVAFVAFIGKAGDTNAFWQFNKTMFLRFLAGVLYSAVLYGGLCAAMGATKFLFNIDITWKSFMTLFAWIAILFQTLFFLSGIPVDLQKLQDDHAYPKGLKLFTQYVLIPLAIVYVVILLSYEVKILVEWNLPKGLVSSLILGYAVFGILSFLLIYPLRKQEENKWIVAYNRTFYYLLIPLLALLFVSVYTRVQKYGITEERYFLIILALWLAGITAYFLLSRKQNILIIPLSLSLVTIAGTYGPLSAFNIAERSQLGQLKEVLEKNKLLNKGKLKPITSKLDSASNDRVIHLSRYMVEEYGLSSLQPLLNQDLELVTDSIKEKLELTENKYGGNRRTHSWDLRNAEREWLEKNYKLPVEYTDYSISYRHIKADNGNVLPAVNADFIVLIDNSSDLYQATTLAALDKDSLTFRLSDSSMTIGIEKDSISRSLIPIINRLEKVKPSPEIKGSGKTSRIETTGNLVVPRASLTEEFKIGKYNIRFYINEINYRISSHAKATGRIEGVLMIKKQE
ncbi:DUF4153 domain-containing protein [Desertivirga brevis]|uniref:DUF4153 domain-containing protein n=1 Tax=Desertivirga brevis TaxID=2810310 RepID=UPI001A96101E|nr:DUF4153 domain-containing protein [Pedobacter sp. SYSU D00873]